MNELEKIQGLTAAMRADIEAIVLDRFPRAAFVEGAAGIQRAVLSSIPPDRPQPKLTDIPGLAEIQTLRRHLSTLSAAELAEMGAASRASTTARELAARQAAARQKEAKRFYNLPAAAARFEVWARADYWTADESAALLLGRDPVQVNPSKLDKELNEVPGWFGAKPERSDFHRRFDDLRLLLSRAAGLPGPNLKPRDVLAWAERTGAMVPPPKLVALVAPPVALLEPAQPENPAEHGARANWTPERLAELAACREAHGTKVAAEKFQITPTRVRQLLPGRPPKPAPASPFSGLVPSGKRAPR